MGCNMDRKESEIFERFFLILFFAIIFYLAYIVARPFLLTVITSGILAFVTYPLYRKILKILYNKKIIASIIMMIFVFSVIAIPISLLGSFLAREAIVGMNSLISFGQEFLVEGGCADSESAFCIMLDQAILFTQSEFFERFIRQSIPNLSLIGTGQGFFLSVTGFIFHSFVMFFAMFFFFIDGDAISYWLKDSIPLKKRYREMIVDRFKSITSGVIYGQLLTSLIQGLLAGIGFYIFELGSPVLFGLLTAFASLFPFVGAIGIWLPATVVKIAYSLSINDMNGVWLGIGMVIYGSFIVSMVDNFIRPKFIGDRAKLHPVLAFMGVLGGISAFGIIGLLLGPLIMALLVSTVEIYKEHIRDG